MIQVASYFRVDKNCKVSINELIRKQKDIERMHTLISKVPGGYPALRLEIPEHDDNIDSSKELRIFIAIPLIFSSFNLPHLRCEGSFTYQNNAMTFNDYEINIEKLIRANNLNELKKQCQAVSDKVNKNSRRIVWIFTITTHSRRKPLN